MRTAKAAPATPALPSDEAGTWTASEPPSKHPHQLYLSDVKTHPRCGQATVRPRPAEGDEKAPPRPVTPAGAGLLPPGVPAPGGLRGQRAVSERLSGPRRAFSRSRTGLLAAPRSPGRPWTIRTAFPGKANPPGTPGLTSPVHALHRDYAPCPIARRSAGPFCLAFLIGKVLPARESRVCRPEESAG